MGSDAGEFCSRMKEKTSVHLIPVGDVFHYRSSRKRTICSGKSSSFIPVNSVSISLLMLIHMLLVACYSFNTKNTNTELMSQSIRFHVLFCLSF